MLELIESEVRLNVHVVTIELNQGFIGHFTFFLLLEKGGDYVTMYGELQWKQIGEAIQNTLKRHLTIVFNERRPPPASDCALLECRYYPCPGRLRLS